MKWALLILNRAALYVYGMLMPLLAPISIRPLNATATDDQGAQTTNRNGLQSVWSLSKVQTRKDNLKLVVCDGLAWVCPLVKA